MTLFLYVFFFFFLNGFYFVLNWHAKLSNVALHTVSYYSNMDSLVLCNYCPNVDFPRYVILTFVFIGCVARHRADSEEGSERRREWEKGVGFSGGGEWREEGRRRRKGEREREGKGERSGRAKTRRGKGENEKEKQGEMGKRTPERDREGERERKKTENER